MFIHISSGNGVAEACRAVWHFYHWLHRHYTFECISLEQGPCQRCFKSILLKSDDPALLALEGTHLWKSTSPFRPKHKRRNWFFALYCYEEVMTQQIEPQKILYHTMKSPKKGGQHVNTTASGVRAIYPPLNLEAVSFDERSQHRNKAIARTRLLNKAEAMYAVQLQEASEHRWKSGKTLERGNPVKIFETAAFRECH